jgi:hypothetical protein
MKCIILAERKLVVFHISEEMQSAALLEILNQNHGQQNVPHVKITLMNVVKMFHQ